VSACNWIGEDAGTGEILAEEIVIRKPLFGGAVERFKTAGSSRFDNLECFAGSSPADA